MIRLLVATLLLAAIAVTVRLKARGAGTTRSIKVSARAAVNRGAVVAIIEAEGRRLLVGASANQVSLLADLGAAGGSDDAGPVSESPEPATPVSPLTPINLPSRGIVSRRSSAPRPAGNETFVQRVRRLTVRTADPSLRPKIANALREETRRKP